MTNVLERPVNKAEAFNKYWDNPNYTFDFKGEKVTLKQAYEKVLTESKKLFEETKKLNKESIPEGKFILYVNNVIGGPVKHPDMAHIKKERYEMMLESETGSRETSKDDFQKANMQYCLGFEKDDDRFKEFIPFEDSIENINFSKCAGVVLSGSEMNVLDDTDESHMKATSKVRGVIREAKAKGVPIMGICFGGQLLANENGAEIEWVKGQNGTHTRMQGIQYIKKTAKMLDKKELFPELEALDTVVESHGQQMNPASIFNKGEILAENPINQAPEIVLFGDKEICLQFHPEVGSLRVETVRTVTEEKYIPENTLNTDLLSTKKIFFHSFLKLVEKSNQKK